MSITLTEMLKLPSFHGARVVAGKQGIDRSVSMISVSEYTGWRVTVNSDADYYGNEVVMSALYASRDSVEKQCDVIREFHANNVAALVLFKVGVIIPYLDDKFISLADELGFPVIVMPGEKLDRRYSEVIYEVMEAVFKSQLVANDLKNDIIEQVSRYHSSQQNVGAVLRILSDKIHSTVILADSTGTPLNAGPWPRSLPIENYLKNGKAVFDKESSKINDEIYHVYDQTVISTKGKQLHAIVYKRGEALSPDAVRQVGEIVQVSINLWDRSNGENMLPEIVGAVLRDEPYKIKRAEASFGISMKDIRDMIVICPHEEEKRDTLMHIAPDLITEEFSYLCDNIVYDVFMGTLVVFILGRKEDTDFLTATESFAKDIKKNGVKASIAVFRNLDDAAQIRKAFRAFLDVETIACDIYPHREFFTYSEIKFAEKCRKIIDGGGHVINQNTEILNFIPKSNVGAYNDMINTLSAYYLDANEDMAKAGELLYLHKNTIQYRLKKYREKAPDGLASIPEIDEMYTALALNRLLEKNTTGEKS